MDKVLLILLARRAEAAYYGLTVEEYDLLNTDNTARVETIVDAILKEAADQIRHVADVQADPENWAGMHEAASLLNTTSYTI